jgi:hypothetical protein
MSGEQMTTARLVNGDLGPLARVVISTSLTPSELFGLALLAPKVSTLPTFFVVHGTDRPRALGLAQHIAKLLGFSADSEFDYAGPEKQQDGDGVQASYEAFQFEPEEKKEKPDVMTPLDYFTHRTKGHLLGVFLDKPDEMERMSRSASDRDKMTFVYDADIGANNAFFGAVGKRLVCSVVEETSAALEVPHIETLRKLLNALAKAPNIARKGFWTGLVIANARSGTSVSQKMREICALALEQAVATESEMQMPYNPIARSMRAVAIASALEKMETIIREARAQPNHVPFGIKHAAIIAATLYPGVAKTTRQTLPTANGEQSDRSLDVMVRAEDAAVVIAGLLFQSERLD